MAKFEIETTNQADQATYKRLSRMLESELVLHMSHKEEHVGLTQNLAGLLSSMNTWGYRC